MAYLGLVVLSTVQLQVDHGEYKKVQPKKCVDQSYGGLT
jgi:hypothetical protein